MKRSHQQAQAWARLTEAARRAPEPSPELPYGFAVRVAGRAMAEVRAPSWLLAVDRFSLRALGISAALVAACVALSYSTIAAATDEWSWSDPVVAMTEAY